MFSAYDINFGQRINDQYSDYENYLHSIKEYRIMKMKRNSEIEEEKRIRKELYTKLYNDLSGLFGNINEKFTTLYDLHYYLIFHLINPDGSLNKKLDKYIRENQDLLRKIRQDQGNKWDRYIINK